MPKNKSFLKYLGCIPPVLANKLTHTHYLKFQISTAYGLKKLPQCQKIRVKKDLNLSIIRLF